MTIRGGEKYYDPENARYGGWQNDPERQPYRGPNSDPTNERSRRDQLGGTVSQMRTDMERMEREIRELERKTRQAGEAINNVTVTSNATKERLDQINEGQNTQTIRAIAQGIAKDRISHELVNVWLPWRE